MSSVNQASINAVIQSHVLGAMQYLDGDQNTVHEVGGELVRQFTATPDWQALAEIKAAVAKGNLDDVKFEQSSQVEGLDQRFAAIKGKNHPSTEKAVQLDLITLRQMAEAVDGFFAEVLNVTVEISKNKPGQNKTIWTDFDIGGLQAQLKAYESAKRVLDIAGQNVAAQVELLEKASGVEKAALRVA